MKIKLCTCFFGGYDGCLCGGPGVIIDNDENEELEEPQLSPELIADKQINEYIKKLSLVHEKIASDSYYDLEITKSNLDNLKKKVHSNFKPLNNSPEFTKWDQKYNDLIEFINKVKSEKESTRVKNVILKGAVSLVDIILNENECYLFKENCKTKSQKLALHFFKIKTSSTKFITCEEFLNIVLQNPYFFERYPYKASLLPGIIAKFEDKEYYDTNLNFFLESNQICLHQNPLNYFKVYIYNSNKKTAFVYYVSSDKLLELCSK